DWVEQATPILTVVSASPSSISAFSPSSIARGSQPVMTFTGAIPTTSTKIAFALSGQCSSSRAGETPLPTTNTATLATPILSSGVYQVCYSVDGVTYHQQT